MNEEIQDDKQKQLEDFQTDNLPLTNDDNNILQYETNNNNNILEENNNDNNNMHDNNNKLFAVDVLNGLLVSETSYEDFLCQWEGCSNTYQSCEELSKHINEFHIGRKQSSYVCMWMKCYRNTQPFNSRSAIIGHLRTHTGDRPFSCPECSQKFSRSDAMRKHLRSHTMSENDSEKTLDLEQSLLNIQESTENVSITSNTNTPINKKRSRRLIISSDKNQQDMPNNKNIKLENETHLTMTNRETPNADSQFTPKNRIPNTISRSKTEKMKQLDMQLQYIQNENALALIQIEHAKSKLRRLSNEKDRLLDILLMAQTSKKKHKIDP